MPARLGRWGSQGESLTSTTPVQTLPKFPCLLPSRCPGPGEPCASQRGSITQRQGLQREGPLGPSGVCAPTVSRCPSVGPRCPAVGQAARGRPGAAPPALVAAPRGARCVVMRGALTSPPASLLTIPFIYLFARLFICLFNYLFVSVSRRPGRGGSEPVPALAHPPLGIRACGGAWEGNEPKIGKRECHY